MVFVNSQKKSKNLEKSQKILEKSEEILQKTGKMAILFVKPKILTSGLLKYLKIPLMVRYKSVRYSARFRVRTSWFRNPPSCTLIDLDGADRG